MRNVARSVRDLFAAATERRVLRRNPTARWNADRHLPPIGDKERGWRAQAGFTLEQVVALTMDQRIPVTAHRGTAESGLLAEGVRIGRKLAGSAVRG